MGHTAWAPDGREGRYQAGPKGRSLEVGARRSPRLLVSYISHCFCCLPQINISYRSYCISCYQNTEAEPGPYYLLSSAAIYIQHWSPCCLYSRFIFFWYKITNSNDNFEIFIFVTLIFLSITHLTLTWPHGAPLQYMCILPPLIPPPLVIPPLPPPPPPPVCTCLIYVSESGWGSLWWIQIPWLQLFSQPQIRQPSIQSGMDVIVVTFLYWQESWILNFTHQNAKKYS